MKQWTYVALALSMVGCAKAKVVLPTPKAAVAGTREMTAAQREDLAKVLQGATLQFDYDEAMLTPFSRGRLELVAEALATRPWATVLIAGHCDERGTEEYNLALGQRRADAARRYLIALGVDPQMIETVTFGAERPADEGHDEAAWSKNRRDELSPKPVPGMEFLSSSEP